MPHCPSCHGRLPFVDVFASTVVACPACHRELQPQRWVAAAATLFTILIVQTLNLVTERGGLPLAARILLSTAGGLTGGALAFAFLVRYRLKAPPASLL